MRNLFIRKAFLLILLLVFVTSGCAYFENKKKEEARELLPVRIVKVVAFPVRPLEFEEQQAKQEKDKLSISGSIKNVSYSPVANVHVRALLFFADESSEALQLQVIPPILQPGEVGEFRAEGIVEQPLSRVELHAQWEEYYPPGL